ncbi:MAG: ribosome maturation factor RimM [Syntrophales bacterium]|nr:ribosome maturation factor RimM [Syntrophales bacterium]MCK9528885.1 ribosome maturation factor RimM [Syntrophales bacterium]
MKAVSYMESPGMLEDRQMVLIGTGDQGASPHRINSITLQGRNLILGFDGIDTIEAAEPLKGRLLYLSRQWLPPLEENEYYWKDIIGLNVMTDNERTLGVITGVLPTGSNDVYICRGDEGELLIPALEDVIVDIDIPKGIMIVNLPEEL